MLTLLAMIAPLAAETAAPDWTFEPNQEIAQLGYEAVVIGDVDGDGFDDLAIVSGYDEYATDTAVVNIIRGSADGLENFVTQVIPNPVGISFFGHAITGGDINGDGYADLLIGAGNCTVDPAHGTEGYVFAYFGGPDGLETWPGWYAVQYAGGALGFYGWSVAADDVNGDGYDDVAVVGLMSHTVEVYHGSAVGPGAAADWSISGYEHDFDNVAFADVNGDGRADLLVGAPSRSNGSLKEGGVYVFHGRASGLRATPHRILEIDLDDANLGASVSGAGDVDGDGFEDVVVGAPGVSNGAVEEGRVYLWRGASTGLSAKSDWFADGNQNSASLGFRVAGAGDVDGDGYADFAGSAPDFDGEVTDEGQLRLWRGGPDGPTESHDAFFLGGQEDAGLGRVLDHGDVNGDGFVNLLTTQHGWDGGEEDEGRALVWYGASIPTEETEDTDDTDVVDTDAAAPSCDATGTSARWLAFVAAGLTLGRRRRASSGRK